MCSHCSCSTVWHERVPGVCGCGSKQLYYCGHCQTTHCVREYVRTTFGTSSSVASSTSTSIVSR
ncbi:hypothetical protein DIRU0_E20978 [Diutina rugosa]